VNDDELMARMRAADPAASLLPADPGRTARLLEDTMSHDTESFLGTPAATQDTPVRRRSPLAWLVAAAAVLVIAGVGVFAVVGGDDIPTVPTAAKDPAPSVMALSARPPTTAKCMVVSPEVLANQQVAFAGTVVAITEGLVTLDVTSWYRGGDADQVTVKAPPENLEALVSAADFQVGQRYLVSASDGFVSVCGLSAAYSDELAAMYSQAFS
jgi:hypothetical protein